MNELLLNQAYESGHKSEAFLKILNGNLNLTDRELKLTAIILDQYAVHTEGGLIGKYLHKFVFNTDGRKLMMDQITHNK